MNSVLACVVLCGPVFVSVGLAGELSDLSAFSKAVRVSAEATSGEKGLLNLSIVVFVEGEYYTYLSPDDETCPVVMHRSNGTQGVVSFAVKSKPHVLETPLGEFEVYKNKLVLSATISRNEFSNSHGETIQGVVGLPVSGRTRSWYIRKRFAAFVEEPDQRGLASENKLKKDDQQMLDRIRKAFQQVEFSESKK